MLSGTTDREQMRLAVLRDFRVRDTEPDESFDRITRLLARLFDMPMAFISLIDESRQWFKARYGFNAGETPREIAFCATTIEEPRILVVPDASKDPRFAGNPLVIGEPHIRFYAGAPLECDNGALLGTVSVVDTKPRTFGDDQAALLRDFAALVCSELQARRATALARERADLDDLTKLPNRSALRSLLQGWLSHHSTAVLYLDLDNFKGVNDSLGHGAGDELLLAVGACLRAALRPGDIVGRQSGDEFVVLASQMSDPAEIRALCHKLRTVLAENIYLRGAQVRVTASIGIYPVPSQSNAEVALRAADSAMQFAKSLGKNRYEFYTPELDSGAERKMLIQQALPHAVERGELTQFYQPEVNLRTGKLFGFEVLIRWDNPALGNPGPQEFIPIAEQTGDIVGIGEFVLDRVCADVRHFNTQTGDKCVFSINVSAVQLRDPSCVSYFLNIIAKHRLSPRQFAVELTEHSMPLNEAVVANSLQRLHDAGLHIILDDFGSANSPLTFLDRFPIDMIKLERAFLTDRLHNPKAIALVSGVIALAHRIGVRVIAEGVETEDLRDSLAGLDCDYGQGYLWGRPSSLEKWADLGNQLQRPERGRSVSTSH